MKQYYAIQKAGTAADIYIFGDIVPFAWFEGDVSANSFVKQIKELDVDVLNVHIDSYGGAVSEGWGIYNALREHKAHVNTYGDGFVASAALFPFLAGDARYASTLSAYFLHQVSVGVVGNATELRSAADEAAMLTDIGISAFTDRTNMDEATVKSLMEAETWLTPNQALEYGIATAITADATPRQMQTIKRDILQNATQRPPTVSTKGGVTRTAHQQPGSTLMQTIAGIFIAQK